MNKRDRKNCDALGNVAAKDIDFRFWLSKLRKEYRLVNADIADRLAKFFKKKRNRDAIFDVD